MSHIRDADRSEVLLFPPALDDYITQDTPIRFIEAFVLSLDLVELGFARATPAATGGPGCASGEKRALEATQQVISSPLFEEASSLIREAADENANIIFGTVIDESLRGEMRITVIATGQTHPDNLDVPTFIRKRAT